MINLINLKKNLNKFKSLLTLKMSDNFTKLNYLLSIYSK